MAQFHVLTGLSGNAIPLEYSIDNTDGGKLVGLREITYVTGWCNISAALGNNSFRYTTPIPIRHTDNRNAVIVTIPDGYYNVKTLEAVFSASVPGFSAKVNHAIGRVELTIPGNHMLVLESIAPIWGFREDTIFFIGPMKSVSERAPGFFNKRNLYVHLDQINATGSVLNGRQSTLLRNIPVSGESYGESRTVTFEKPEFRQLRHDRIQELNIRIIDDDGTDISTLVQPISVTLEIV